ncbi:hypothetical protein BRADI_3g50342v3 [Brachypodium distachyon]|uniref:Uncharacterized protein n=1 Tax=Brachypodium distachyon TaxID=15368 RepID=A0A2K2D4F1_BRADI|nr:hypothetical protein BRADI_3g50342v3 [Brachypodium distachyon]
MQLCKAMARTGGFSSGRHRPAASAPFRPPSFPKELLLP